MDIKIRLLDEHVSHDLIMSFETRLTIGELSKCLVNHIGLNIPGSSTGRLTLCGTPPRWKQSDETWVLFDPGTAVLESGIASGWTVALTVEHTSILPRYQAVYGWVTVRQGTATGLPTSLIFGKNTIGRDRNNRVRIQDRSVSRNHAFVEIGAKSVIVDVGSANGLRAAKLAEPVVDLPLQAGITTDVWVGEIHVQITLTASHELLAPFSAKKIDYSHTCSPTFEPQFLEREWRVPDPPSVEPRGRLPLLALLAPIILGVLMFAVTGSMLSLFMVIISPMLLIGSWIDSKISGKRLMRRAESDFLKTLQLEHKIRLETQNEELAARRAETPTQRDVAEAIVRRTNLMWSRGVTHKHRLGFTLGDASQASRAKFSGDNNTAQTGIGQAQRAALIREFQTITAPKAIYLRECGGIGVGGEPVAVNGLVRSIVMQLCGLHSPRNMQLFAVCGGQDTAEEWKWLQWLPHMRSAGSGRPIEPFATDDSISDLLNCLESHTHSSNYSLFDGSAVKSTVQAGTADRECLDTVIVVFDQSLRARDRSRLIALSEQGVQNSIYVIWVAQRLSSVPFFSPINVEFDADGSGMTARIIDHTLGSVSPLLTVEKISRCEAEFLARRLAPVIDSAQTQDKNSELPKVVSVNSVHGTDLLHGPSAIVQQWIDSRSLRQYWKQGTKQNPVSLRTTVGRTVSGYAELDLRAHGPHALLGGTTGSGKSEFLQTWLMSMAANLSPEQLVYLLIDYKGGAAFSGCIDLPHTVGLVTDLSVGMVQRALISLRAELRLREAVLASFGASNIIEMEERCESATPPVLVIVIDEFATLVKEHPEFVDGVIDIAQRGRSLGVHLILATQRPAGVISENLRANTNIRIVLRVADESESRDVIGTSEAASFPVDAPGRAALKIGTQPAKKFQSSYLGTLVVGATGQTDVVLKRFDQVRAHQNLSADSEQTVAEITEFSVMKAGIVAAAEQLQIPTPRSPWLPMLVEHISLSELGKMAADNEKNADPARSKSIIIGLIDRPDEQRYQPFQIDLSKSGNLVVYGASGSGKTQTLVTLVAACATSEAAIATHVYVIDAANGGLAILNSLPTLAAIARADDDEMVMLILQTVFALIDERINGAGQPRGQGERMGDQSPVQESERDQSSYRVLLLIDGYSHFRDRSDEMTGTGDAEKLLNRIMQQGRAVHVHVVLTVMNPSQIPASLSTTIQTRIVLRLASNQDYAYLGISPSMLTESPPGRAVVVGSPYLAQIACIGETGSSVEFETELRNLGAFLGLHSAALPKKLQHLPAAIYTHEVDQANSCSPVFGLTLDLQKPVFLPLKGLGVITGSARSGRSTTSFSCTQSYLNWMGKQNCLVRATLVSGSSKRDAELQNVIAWDYNIYSAVALEEAVNRLESVRINGLIQSETANNEACAEVFLFHELHLLSDPVALKLASRLMGLVRASGAIGVVDWAENESSEGWAMTQAVRLSDWVIELQPAGQSGLGHMSHGTRTQRNASYRAGQGLFTDSGVTLPVQCARLPLA